MGRIDVTRSFLPPLDDLRPYLDRIWQSNQLTNQGPLVVEFEAALKRYLELEDSHLHFVANGTVALQLALRSLGITGGEVITTPFSYVATVSSILWERCTPVFVDIDPRTLCMDPDLIEAAITPRTQAVLPVHVFGNAADVIKIGQVARENDIPVIYDGAHAFGSQFNGQALLSYGDIAVTSFHATKTMHTIEGGAVITASSSIHEELDLIKRFGHNGDQHLRLGINAKANELTAAMGLVNLRYQAGNAVLRRRIADYYDSRLTKTLARPVRVDGLVWNHAYYPVLFESEQRLLNAQAQLNAHGIYPRRYFYPALNTLPYLDSHEPCPVAEDTAGRILCLPLYPGLEESELDGIVQTVNAAEASSGLRAAVEREVLV